MHNTFGMAIVTKGIDGHTLAYIYIYIQVNRKTFHECLGDIGMAQAQKPTKQAQMIHLQPR